MNFIKTLLTGTALVILAGSVVISVIVGTLTFVGYVSNTFGDTPAMLLSVFFLAFYWVLVEITCVTHKGGGVYV